MLQFLRSCEKIEYLASTAYKRLAANRAFDLKIRETFQVLSKDEVTHARLVDMALQIPGHDIEIVEQRAAEQANVFLVYAQALLEEIDQECRTEYEALQMALDLEKYFLKFHINNAISFLNPKIEVLFKHLGNQDRKHLELLLDCLRRWKTQQENPSKTH